MTDIYNVSLPHQGALDVDGRAVTAYANKDTDITHLAGLVSKHPLKSGSDTGSKIGVINDADIPYCSTRAEFFAGLLRAASLKHDESLCVRTNEGRWALVQIAFPRSNYLLKLRIGFLK
ncbi:hypothetical protein [Streptomyces sp. NPDC059788]|uniref:hypothetical protein n=1 Tax=Streptomyces sp. NPDC059788 TaxID=3346948 RepID=UPI00364A5B24